jgi:hypothetical protein
MRPFGSFASQLPQSITNNRNRFYAQPVSSPPSWSIFSQERSQASYTTDISVNPPISSAQPSHSRNGKALIRNQGSCRP